MRHGTCTAHTAICAHAAAADGPFASLLSTRPTSERNLAWPADCQTSHACFAHCADVPQIPSLPLHQVCSSPCHVSQVHARPHNRRRTCTQPHRRIPATKAAAPTPSSAYRSFPCALVLAHAAARACAVPAATQRSPAPLTSAARERRPPALHLVRLRQPHMHRCHRAGAQKGIGPTNPYEYIVASVT